MTSRLVVFDNIKKWRKNRTTIVITHDLSQIQPSDFVYLMKNGVLYEQGYRADLVSTDNSEFGKLATMQAEQPLLKEDTDIWADAGEDVEMILEDVDRRATRRMTLRPTTMQIAPTHQSRGYLDYLSLIGDSEKNTLATTTDAVGARTSALAKLEARRTSETNSYHQSFSSALQPPNISYTGRQLSHRFQRQSAMARRHLSRTGIPRHSMFVVTTDPKVRSDEEKESVDDFDPDAKFVVTIDNAPKVTKVLRNYFPGMPRKWLIVLGAICSVGHGILTPLWSNYIAVLMAYVSYGATDTAQVTKTSLIVVGITIANSVALSGQYFFFDNMAAHWMIKLRKSVYDKVLSQPQSWFDRRTNSPGRLVQILIKDVDDMKAILSTVIGRSITAVSMIVAGITWAMVTGWKLTLVGLAVGPVFAIVIVISARVNTGLEAKNKEAREQVSRTFYEVSRRRMSHYCSVSDTHTPPTRALRTSVVSEQWL